jgi:hypothetical protein
MSLLNSLIPIATDSEGRTVKDALLYSYAVGTNTPKDTYSDQALTLPNANPLESDGAGRFFNLFLGAGGYKLVLRDRFDVVLWEQDDYYPALDTGDLANINASIDAVAQQLSQSFFSAIETGAADAYVLDGSNTTGAMDLPDAYHDFMQISFAPSNTNTGPSTVNVNSLGAKTLYYTIGVDLPAGFLETGRFYTFLYIAGGFLFIGRSGLIVESSIQDGAVTTPKIEDLAVTTDKIADNDVTPAKMSDGTAYKLAGYSSGNAFTEYTNPMRLIDSGSFTAAANKSFVLSTLDTAQSADNVYLLRLVGFQPVTDDDQLVYLTMSTDAGSTYVATNYYYSLAGTDSGGSAVGNTANNGAAQTQAVVLGGSGGTYGLSNVANETACLDLYLYNFNTGSTANRPYILGSGLFWAANASVLVRQSISVSQTAAGDYDAIKLTLEAAGNFAAVGKYYLYKMAGVI